MNNPTEHARKSVSIQLHQCKKNFRETVALYPLDLTIKAGEILVLLGPSGCGKTTLLRIIAGLEQVDAGGKIVFNGKEVTQLPIEKRHIGMVFQSYALFPNMTVADNITYGLRVRKQNKKHINSKLQEMLKLFDLKPYENRNISQLSGGQCQRVALARAIITEPDVLLLDEPLSALDALLRERLRTDIQKLLKQLNITAVYVTHDQQEAMAVADRIAVINQGKIEQIGTPEQLYLLPESHFVADFIGQINLLVGKTNEQHFIIESGNKLQLPDREINQKAQWAARPEDLRLAEKNTPNSFTATIVSRSFLGDRTRVEMVYGEQRKLIMDCFERHHYPLGETIHLSVSPQKLIQINSTKD